MQPSSSLPPSGLHRRARPIAATIVLVGAMLAVGWVGVAATGNRATEAAADGPSVVAAIACVIPGAQGATTGDAVSTARPLSDADHRQASGALFVLGLIAVLFATFRTVDVLRSRAVARVRTPARDSGTASAAAPPERPAAR